MAKRYTIVVIPNLSGESRRFTISAGTVQFFLVILVLVAVTSVYFTHRHIKLSKEVVELEGLRAETRQQREKIQQFSQKVKEFNLVMKKLDRFDKKLRAITALKQDDSGYAVGGPVEEKISLSDFLRDDDGDLMVRLEREMGRLKDQARLQEISLLEIDRFFKEQSSLLSSTPSIWPSRGWVTSGFGYRNSPFTGKKEMHEGIDIATRNGAPIIAPAEGVVVRAGKDLSFGMLVEIDHGYGVLTRYGHNSAINVSVGDMVARGQKIASVGSTGRSTGPHLHYEVLLNGVPVNPFRYILDER